MSKSYIIGLVAETPVHVGIGAASDAIDLPVAREKATFYPHVPGSGVKGAFRVWAKGHVDKDDVDTLFGKDLTGKDVDGKPVQDTGADGAGTLIFSEARLALLPVRCTSESFKLATCPKIISRLLGDMQRFGVPDGGAKAPSVADGKYLGAGDDNFWLGLEEREFQRAGEVVDLVIRLFAPLTGGGMDEAELKQREAELKQRIVVLSNTDFQWFAQFGLPVAMRNKLDDNKIVAGSALWSEETLPTDSVMWMGLGERAIGAAEALADGIETARYIQMGGNETIGQGWFKMNVAGGV